MSCISYLNQGFSVCGSVRAKNRGADMYGMLAPIGTVRE